MLKLYLLFEDVRKSSAFPKSGTGLGPGMPCKYFFLEFGSIIPISNANINIKKISTYMFRNTVLRISLFVD